MSSGGSSTLTSLLWQPRNLLFLPGLAVLLLALTILYNLFLHPLAKIPGPRLAAAWRLWFARTFARGNFDKVIRKLHDEHGTFVRVAPNEVSINEPGAVLTIYGIKSKFTKNEFYPPWRPTGFNTKHVDQFTDTDEAHHSSRRKLLSNIYSMSSVLESEVYIDQCTSLLQTKLDEYVDKSEPCDLGRWLQMYAFDVIGELYFGEAFGFLKSGSDYGNYIATLDILLPLLGTSAVLSPALRVPWMLFGLLRGEVRRGITCMQSIEALAKEQVGKRAKLLKSSEKTNLRRDMLAKLFEVHETKGETHDFQIPDIEQEAHVGIFAGSDTTAIAMRSIVDNLLRHPESLAKLQAELDSAFVEGQLSIPVTYAQASKLPFFVACVKEGMRLHPSVGLHLPRIVPAGGCEIAGQYFPGGSVVGVNPTVIHRNATIFGMDANQFRPERWWGETKVSEMERFMLTFGGGTRTCIGKNISLSEVHKLLATLFLMYDFELVNREQQLKTFDFWFHKQEGLIVMVSPRKYGREQ